MTGGPSSLLAGRVAVVTGATSGIGRELARGIALRGAKTVVVGRGEERAAGVAREIAQSSGNPSVESVGVVDLALRSEVRRVSAVLLERYPRIDILVNNAGGYFQRREVTSEGLERTFALNVVAPFLLTSLVIPRLLDSAPARVVNVASAAHRSYTVDFADLQGSQHYAGYTAYGRSKLELILLTREFARRLHGRGLTFNAVHPGFVRSGFGQNNGGATAVVIRLLAFLFGKRAERGADTPLFVATDPSVGSVDGEYFSNRTVTRGSRASYDVESARRLYSICRELTDAPGVPEPPLPPVVGRSPT
jgi:retinol dehydrogenase 14